MPSGSGNSSNLKIRAIHLERVKYEKNMESRGGDLRKGGCLSRCAPVAGNLPFCGKASRRGICRHARKAVDRLVIREPRCMQCGRPVRSPEQEYCRDCMEVRRSFDQGVSLWLHKKPVPWSVYQFKYHNQRRFSHFYAEEMSKGFGPQIARWRPDLLVPVPLHKKRLRKRGFNQAALLAEDLSRRLGIPADKEALVRTRDTTAQKRLGRQDRRRNITGAFTVSKNFRPVPDRTSRRRYLHHRKYYGCGRKSTPCGRRSKSLLFNDKYWTRIRIFVILKMMFRSQ